MNGRLATTVRSPVEARASSKPLTIQRICPSSVAQGRARVDELAAEAGQQRLEMRAALRQQAVDVPALRHGSALDEVLGQLVAVEDRHARVRPGEGRGREQPADAAADDHGVAHQAAFRFQAPIISGHMAACPPDSAVSRARSSNHRSLCSSVVSPSARAPGRTLR